MPLHTQQRGSGCAELLQGYRFEPGHLGADQRPPGISAYMRIRNGADFLRPTILGHLGFYDEVVAVFNQCTDDTEAILLSLAQQHPGKLRVIHYLDRVFPPGSEGHAATPGDSPHSMVNYSNAALAATRYNVVVKLDDDHIALHEPCARLVAGLRRDLRAVSAMHCFSGLNLARAPEGWLGVMARPAFSGNGDISYAPMRPDTYYVHDRRFERFQRGGLARVFAGYLYWHMKYLKTGGGYANYELDSNPNSRFARRRARQAGAAKPVLTLGELKARTQPGLGQRLVAALSPKHRLMLTRDLALADAFAQDDMAQALRDTVAPELLPLLKLPDLTGVAKA